MNPRTRLIGCLLIGWFAMAGCPPIDDGLSQWTDDLAAGVDTSSTAAAAAGENTPASGEPDPSANRDTRPDAYADIPLSPGGGPGARGVPGGDGTGGDASEPNTDPRNINTPVSEPEDPEEPDQDLEPLLDPDSSLPPEVQFAVIDAGRELIALTRALSPMAGLADERFSWNPNTAGQTGFCPAIKWGSGDDSTIGVMDFEYDGCAGELTGGLSFAGNLAGFWFWETSGGQFEHCVFSIDGRAVTSHFDGVVQRKSGGVEVYGVWNVSTAGLSSAVGEIKLLGRPDYSFTLDTDWLRLGEPEIWLDVLLECVRVDVRVNGNFLPAAGVASFTLEDPAYEVAITFTAETPSTRLVGVSVNGQPPEAFRLPELP